MIYILTERQITCSGLPGDRADQYTVVLLEDGLEKAISDTGESFRRESSVNSYNSFTWKMVLKRPFNSNT